MAELEVYVVHITHLAIIFDDYNAAHKTITCSLSLDPIIIRGLSLKVI